MGGVVFVTNIVSLFFHHEPYKAVSSEAIGVVYIEPFGGCCLHCEPSEMFFSPNIKSAGEWLWVGHAACA